MIAGEELPRQPRIFLSARRSNPLQPPGVHGINKAMKNVANFLFEAGMLKRTPRSGFQFLGSGAESVAEHIFRTTYIGYTLGRLAKGVDVDRMVKMCLFHDLPEARTGDLNYVNKKYVEADEKKAVEDLARTLPFGHEIQDLIREFTEGKTEEAKLARDADQLEFVLALKEYKDLGNKYADEWLEFSLRRLQTDAARELAKVILETDSSLWWFSDKSDWWVSGGKR
jgi:putative hydrolase of HD superfamily